ncbi:MAG: Gmad2 immunoglobulin-like domain-containing protein [Candidatus Paceibacterota bacterium]
MAFHTKRTRLLLGFFLVFLIVGMYVQYRTSKNETVPATSFEECVALGNSVMESYPRQCTTKDGLHFTENIGDESGKGNLIRLYTPQPNQEIVSPLTIQGEARGYWFFEGSFPITITNWDGLIIGEHYATAEGDWMTEEFVPFTATIEFETPVYGSNGVLILKKDNPSALPEHDDALEIPIMFKDVGLVPIQEETSTRIIYTTNQGFPEEPFIQHCALQGGTFNACGSLCAADQICAQVCAYTCEF